MRTEFAHFWQMTKTMFLARYGKQNPVLAKLSQDKMCFWQNLSKQNPVLAKFWHFFFETYLLANFSGDGFWPPLNTEFFFMVPLYFFLIPGGDATSNSLYFERYYRCGIYLATPKMPVLANCGQNVSMYPKKGHTFLCTPRPFYVPHKFRQTFCVP